MPQGVRGVEGFGLFCFRTVGINVYYSFKATACNKHF